MHHVYMAGLPCEHKYEGIPTCKGALSGKLRWLVPQVTSVGLDVAQGCLFYRYQSPDTLNQVSLEVESNVGMRQSHLSKQITSPNHFNG